MDGNREAGRLKDLTPNEHAALLTCSLA